MPDEAPVIDQTHLTLTQAGEYYVHAFDRGRSSGALDERDRIIKKLLSPEFQDQVDKEWKGDMPIYDAIVKVLKSQRVSI